MNAEVTYDLYEEPTRWSRAVVILCAVAVAVLALWIFVPPALRHFAPASMVPRQKAVIAAPLRDQPAQTVDTATRAAATKSVRSVSYDSAPTAPSAAITAVETPQPALANTPDSESSVAQDSPPANTPISAAAAGQLAQGAPPAVWAPIQPSSPPPASAFEEDAKLITRPPLPRARPHQLSLAGSLGIPLPHPRPFIATETTDSVPETSTDRPDFF
jgi:hypothetical protein